MERYRQEDDSMEEIKINNAVYCVQHIFLGEKSVSDLIQCKICEEKPQVFPLTSSASPLYNKDGERSAVRRYNEP